MNPQPSSPSLTMNPFSFRTSPPPPSDEMLNPCEVSVPVECVPPPAPPVEAATPMLVTPETTLSSIPHDSPPLAPQVPTLPPSHFLPQFPQPPQQVFVPQLPQPQNLNLRQRLQNLQNRLRRHHPNVQHFSVPSSHVYQYNQPPLPLPPVTSLPQPLPSRTVAQQQQQPHVAHFVPSTSLPFVVQQPSSFVPVSIQPMQALRAQPSFQTAHAVDTDQVRSLPHVIDFIQPQPPPNTTAPHAPVPPPPMTDGDVAVEQIKAMQRLLELRDTMSRQTAPASAATHASQAQAPETVAQVPPTPKRFDQKLLCRFSRRNHAISSTPRNAKKDASQSAIQPTLQQSIRRPQTRQPRQQRRIIRIPNLRQAPATWYGSLTLLHNANNKTATVKVPVAAFSYTLRTKQHFTAQLPGSLNLTKQNLRKFDEVIESAANGSFFIRISPVNDYGQTVVHDVFTAYIRFCLSCGHVHEISVDEGKVLLFPVVFPQVGLCFVGVLVGS